MTAIVAFYATIPLKTYRQYMEHINVVVHITVCIVTYFRKKQKPLHSITTVTLMHCMTSSGNCQIKVSYEMRSVERYVISGNIHGT